uniref:EB domain-containing protein n=1 Tax=Coptotermes formosanus TaxID=36987 RepID=R4UNV6_COPFO|nr:hypothetical protein [Coptotermes formosanus]
MAHSYGSSFFCFILLWLVKSNITSAEVSGLGVPCETVRDCSSIANSKCINSTCACPPDFVPHSTNSSCIPGTTNKSPRDVTSEPEHQTSPLADGNGTTTATSGSELAKNTSIPHHAEKEKSARQQEKHSGGSSVVPISFLAVIWVAHLVT